jgi:hypothetical protein
MAVSYAKTRAWPPLYREELNCSPFARKELGEMISISLGNTPLPVSVPS